MKCIGLVLACALHACLATLQQYDADWGRSSLEQITERSIYQASALISTKDHLVNAAASDDGPVGAYARKMLRIRRTFHKSGSLKKALERMYEGREHVLTKALTFAQDRLYSHLLYLTSPGQARDALVKYAVLRREGVPLGHIQNQLAQDPGFHALNNDPGQSFLKHAHFGAVMRIFEQDIVDGNVKGAELIGNGRLKDLYLSLALAQLDAQISLAQQQMHHGVDKKPEKNFVL